MPTQRRILLWPSIVGTLAVAAMFVMPALVRPGFAESPTSPARVRGDGATTFVKDLDPQSDVPACTFTLRADTDQSAPSPTPSQGAEPAPATGTFECRMAKDA